MILIGDCMEHLRALPDNHVDCCVTSPPYWGLRDYGHNDQLGLEKTPEEYVAKMVEVFREVKRVLKPDGTLWLNLGDSYASTTKGTGGPSDKQDSNAGSRYAPYKLNHGVKDKDLCGIPWRVAFALQRDGWWLRQDIIWHKPNPMPESVTDRCTKSHEYIFLLSKSATYYYDADAIKEKATTEPHAPGYVSYDKNSFRNDRTDGNESNSRNWGSDGNRNKRSVWTVPTKPYKGAHFAVYPEELIYPCILAGCPRGGVVLDPFAGSGTTGYVAKKHGREFILIELNENYLPLINERLQQEVLI